MPNGPVVIGGVETLERRRGEQITQLILCRFRGQVVRLPLTSVVAPVAVDSVARTLQD